MRSAPVDQDKPKGATMKCSQCGAELLQNARFCSKCGHTVTTPDRGSTAPQMPSETPVPRKPSPGAPYAKPVRIATSRKAAAVGIILLVALGAGLGGWLVGNKGLFGDGDSQDTTVVISPTTTAPAGTIGPSLTATPHRTTTVTSTPTVQPTVVVQPTPTQQAVVEVSVDDDPSIGPEDAAVTSIDFDNYQ